jgi:hypothetical protein
MVYDFRGFSAWTFDPFDSALAVRKNIMENRVWCWKVLI